MSDNDVDRLLDEQVLDVYESRDGGWWNPDHGEVEIPEGWELLPAGGAYLTRTVKQLAPRWIDRQPRTRHHPGQVRHSSGRWGWPHG